MHSTLILMLAALAVAAPAPQSSDIKGATTCPGIDEGQVFSSNNQAYRLHCAKWIDSDQYLNITGTETGYKGCLTACDETPGCGAVEYVATDEAQTKGSCTVFPISELKDGALNTWTVAVPFPTESSTNSTRFGGIAIHSGSEIQYLSVNANEQAFWLNRNTTTYCPDNIPCPKDDDPQTIFASSGTGTLSLDVIVPGGQQVYVTSEGQLKFTQAHSASMEEGALVTGFNSSDGALVFENNDWWACPLGPMNGNAYGIWAVSRVKGSNAGEQCTSFRFRTQSVGNASSVWQYE